MASRFKCAWHKASNSLLGPRCFHRVNGTQRPGPSALPWNLKLKAYLAKKFMKLSASVGAENRLALSHLSQPSPARPGPAHSGSVAITIPQSWWPRPSLSQISCPPPRPQLLLISLLSFSSLLTCCDDGLLSLSNLLWSLPCTVSFLLASGTGFHSIRALDIVTILPFLPLPLHCKIF